MTILESRHGKGTFVSSLDPGLLSEPINFILQADTSVIASLFEVRRMVEVDAAGLAAERITPEALEALETLVEKAEQVIGDEQAFVRYDFEIHEAITHAVRNPILNSICAHRAPLP
jgi:GntR family transcriptional repressor for pyruvate dehydrogenase complex